MKVISRFVISNLAIFLASSTIAGECDNLKPDMQNANASGNINAYAECLQTSMQKQLLTKGFNFNPKNKEQIQTFITQKLIDYFAALKECRVGQYKYLFIGETVVTANIQGMQNNQCIVDISAQQVNDLLKNNPRIIYTLKCQFQKDSLPSFTQEAASSFFAGADHRQVASQSAADKAFNLLKTSCKESSSNYP